MSELPHLVGSLTFICSGWLLWRGLIGRRTGRRERVFRIPRIGDFRQRIGNARERRREIGKLNQGKQEADDPINVVVREKRYERQDSDKLILNFCRSVGN